MWDVTYRNDPMKYVDREKKKTIRRETRCSYIVQWHRSGAGNPSNLLSRSRTPRSILHPSYALRLYTRLHPNDMFKLPDNVFETVDCPDITLTGECHVVNCLFKHDTKQKRKASITDVHVKRAKTDLGLDQKENRPNEKEQERTNGVQSEKITRKDVLLVIPRAVISGKVVIPRTLRLECARRISTHLVEKNLSKTPNLDAMEKELVFATDCSSIADYEEKVAKYVDAKKSLRVDPKHVSPLEVNPSPAMLPVRRKYVELFVEAIKRMETDEATPILRAMDEEYSIASTNSSSTYNWAVKRRLYEINHPEKVKKAKTRQFTRAEYLRELRNLCIPTEKLSKFGYIMEFPEPIESPEQLRNCNRCKQEFKLEDAACPVECRYHSGRMVKNDHKVRIYLCCGGVVGETDTDPCALADRHVFYWLNPQELHHFLPFVKTAENWGTKKGSLEAVGIDCEMGFTTQGFELLRVSAVDFFSGEEVVDILVRPKGEVLDLNTRWSGVAEIKEEAVSFEDTMTLLGEIIDANTVMIGHGLENDMNAMRLIHEKVVDTAILYPKHKATPTFRFSLKQLVFQYLGRTIQTGEHDSAEDSIAAIDITKYFIEQDLAKEI